MLTNLEWFLMLWLALVIFANAILGGECIYWRRKCEEMEREPFDEQTGEPPC